MVAEVAERAYHLKQASSFLLCGGVAQSALLQSIFKKLAEENNTTFGVAPPEFNRDNGAMIAYAASLLDRGKYKNLEEINALPFYRIEQLKEEFGNSQSI